MKGAFLISLIYLTISLSYAQQPALLHDINPGSGSGSPSWLNVYNNKLVFNASNGINGAEFWAYDGINAPAMVSDINPGTGSSIPMTNNIGKMGMLNGVLYFCANNGSNGTELFQYSGTGIPSMVADLEPGSVGSFPISFVSLGGKLYFSAITTGFGRELWTYDAATGNSQRLSDINTVVNSNVLNLCVFNNRVYFAADDPTAGRELFSFDPSSGNITQLDINSGASGSTPHSLTVIGNKLYFSAFTDSHGRELYAYDGSNAPVRLTDIMTGPANSVAYNDDFKMIEEMNGHIIFSANTTVTSRDLYRYDPATSLVTVVANPNAVTDQVNFCLYAGKLYFNGRTNANGTELWVYDGINAPTMVADINQGAGNSHPYELTVFSNKMYFRVVDAAAGSELFVLSDPTAGIATVGRVSGTTVYPNPAKNNVTIKFNLFKEELLQFRLVDITGKEVYSSEKCNYSAGQNYKILPVGTFANGVYYYYLQDELGTVLASGQFAKG